MASMVKRVGEKMNNRDDFESSTPSGVVVHALDGSNFLQSNLNLIAGFYAVLKWNYHNQIIFFRMDIQCVVRLPWIII